MTSSTTWTAEGDLPPERMLPVAPLARRVGTTPEHLTELLLDGGYRLLRISERALRVPESEWLRFLADSERRARA